MLGTRKFLIDALLPYMAILKLSILYNGRKVMAIFLLLLGWIIQSMCGMYGGEISRRHVFSDFMMQQ